MATASQPSSRPPWKERYHPLTLWQRDRYPAEAAQAARQLLVDIATARAQACTALRSDPDTGRPRPQRTRAEYAPEQWRSIVGGVAVGEAACLLALARGLLLDRDARRLDSNCLDAVLMALALATRCGSRPERIIASMEMLTLLPEVIGGGTPSRTRRARGLAVLFRTFRMLRWELSGRATLVPHTIMAPLVEAWMLVDQAAIQQGLPPVETDKQALSVALACWTGAKPPDAERPEEAGQEDEDIDLGQRTNTSARGPVGPAAVGDVEPLSHGLTPFPDFDPSRLTDNRTVLARRYDALKTRLPLAAVPPREATDRALATLATEMPNFAAVIERVGDELALGRRLGPHATLRLPPFLLVGPPGIGKTRVARQLANSLGLAFASLALAGASDNRELAGTARGWSSAHPAWPVEQLAHLRSANPMLLVDEIDKAGGSDQNGRPAATLLAMLEPTTAAVYQDECLGGPIDLSHINWILSANSANDLPAALMSRLIVLTVTAPEPDQVGRLLDSMAHDLAREHGLTDPRLLPVLSQDAQDQLHTGYRAHRDPRRLRAALGKSLAAAARREESDDAMSMALN